MQNIQKVRFECQPGKVCTEIHGFQTAVLHVRTARILKEPVNKKTHDVHAKVSMVLFQNPQDLTTEMIGGSKISGMKNDS